MGGAGSGGWCRTGVKRTVEQARALRIGSILDLMRPGSLGIGTIQWRDALGAVVADVGAVVDLRPEVPPGVRLRYRVASAGAVDERVPLVTTQMHHGGRRWWLACPSCRRRAGVLYLTNGRFICRRCGRLGYESQRTSHRVYELARLAEQGLGEQGFSALDAFDGLLDVCEAARLVERRYERLMRRQWRELRRGQVGRPRKSAPRWRPPWVKPRRKRRTVEQPSV